MKINHNRDIYLTEFGKETLKDRYLLKGESFQHCFARVAKQYSDSDEHAQRLYDYISKLWFMPATPILSNGGTDRGNPISCFLNEMGDSLNGIFSTWNETSWLACRGGGIGTYVGNIRSIGEDVGDVGKTSGLIPFLKVQDSFTLALNQGSLRRASSAVYCHVSHPEIEEFLRIRKPTGGDYERKSLNIHNAVVLDDKFMIAVRDNLEYELVSPKDQKVKKVISARGLWHEILSLRMETGEPYILWEGNVDKNKPEALKKLGIKIKTSNLCSEITLPTGEDHLGNWRTAVCCLSSVNLEKYDDWKDNPMFIKDCLSFLDNVLQDFIDKLDPNKYMKGSDKHQEVVAMKNARYSAMRERSVGLGVMGLHSYFQLKNIPFESVMAKVVNKNIFKHLKESCDEANRILAIEKGSCPDNEEVGILGRMLHCTAIAPTASISVICGTTSPGIEPFNANAFTQKTLSGSFTVENKHLKNLLKSIDKDTPEVWKSIRLNEGSVQHLDFLSQQDKDVYKTAFELNNQWIVELACDRAEYIDQGQSVNLFLQPGLSKEFVARIHFDAWKKGLKSLYYCRSLSVGRAEKDLLKPNKVLGEPIKYDECIACQ